MTGPAIEEQRRRRFALGVGLTNACNLACAHCYRGAGEDSLSPRDVLAAIDALPVRAVNFGTGENGLHPDFEEIVRRIAERGIDVTMTTNGKSAEVLPDETLALFRDVEFSIDHPTQTAHDQARGAGNWELIDRQMERCRTLGVGVCLVSVLMSTNARAMKELAALAKRRAALLRVNLYQAVRGDLFSVPYDAYWAAIADLLSAGDLVACGEPIVRAVLGLPRIAGAGCGVETVRVTPRGAVVPCVYGRDEPLDLDDLRALGPRVVEDPTFVAIRSVPQPCRACPQVETCGGGCASRRALRGSLDRPDDLCPFVRALAPPTLPQPEVAAGAPPPKASSACTMIVRPR